MFNGTIKIWFLNDNQVLKFTKIFNHTSKVNLILLLEDKNILISSGDGIKFWNLTNYEIIFSFNDIYTHWNTGLERLDDDRIIVCNSWKNLIVILISKFQK